LLLDYKCSFSYPKYKYSWFQDNRTHKCPKMHSILWQKQNWNKRMCRLADICSNDSKSVHKWYISRIQTIPLPACFARTEEGQIEIHQHKSPQINSHTHEQRQTHMQLNTVLHTRRVSKRRCHMYIYILVNVYVYLNYTCGGMVRFIPALFPRPSNWDHM